MYCIVDPTLISWARTSYPNGKSHEPRAEMLPFGAKSRTVQFLALRNECPESRVERRAVME